MERLMLNEQLPYTTIVRYPWEQQLADVPLAYYKNMVDLSNFLSGSLGVTLSHSPLLLSMTTTLGDQKKFNEWILECHKIASTGIDGSRVYKGRSNRRVSIIKDVSGFRGNKQKVVLKIDPRKNTATAIYKVARYFDDPLVQGTRSLDEWVDFHSDDFLEIYRTSDLPQGEIPSIISIADAKNFSIEYVPNFGGNVLCGFKYSDEFEYYYPGSKFIDNYLGLMRKHLIDMISYYKNGDVTNALSSLASYYQVGVRSQAVRGVWNSVLMSHVNEIIYRMGYKRVSHIIHDYLALLMKDEVNFKKYFVNMITANNSK